MKQVLKNDDMLELINKIQAQLIALDRKLDTLISRSLTEAQLSPKSTVDNNRLLVRPADQNKGRTMYTAICADCNKECKIPFKPNGERPVYCQDCFSRRKVIKLSGIKVDDKLKEALPVQPTVNKVVDNQKPQAKKTKKTVVVKKSVGKKKSTSKKK